MISYAWSPLCITVPLPIRLVYHYFVIHHSYCCAALALAPICNFWSSFLVNNHLDRVTVSFNNTEIKWRLPSSSTFQIRLGKYYDFMGSSLKFDTIANDGIQFGWYINKSVMFTSGMQFSWEYISSAESTVGILSHLTLLTGGNPNMKVDDEKKSILI